MSKRVKYDYTIGTSVYVSATSRTEYGHDGRQKRLVTIPCDPFRAWVVGVVHRQEGSRFWGCEDEPNHFECSKVHMLYQVRRSLTSPIEEVRPDMMVLHREYEGELPPVRIKTPIPNLTDEDREELRKEARKIPRGPDGKWRKV